MDFHKVWSRLCPLSEHAAEVYLVGLFKNIILQFFNQNMDLRLILVDKILAEILLCQ